ncbi:MAG TPA: hypothetical protein IAB59_00625 [Candidatus Onthousia faecipullorum]|uniref:Sulfatase-modifying factor enzyme domain-containing protein n=1 Tax=Candidatus Onthousia faecipullorum TaxID=2840887 RepID=A0A9D1G9Y2_9FIRM|nr:hypothetical protein [Candidatus Onthousia faecipullorum]
MNEKKKYIIISVVIILISIIALIGSSYALLTITLEGDKDITLTAGILNVDFSEGDSINLDNASPLTDSEGLKTTPYTFTITNTGNINAYYHVSLEENSNNTLDNSYIKMRLTNNLGYDSGVVTVNDYGKGEFDIKGEEPLKPSNTVTYSLWMWLDGTSGNEVQGTQYQSKIVVTSYDREQKNSPNPPVLDDNMIAARYDGNNWVKADTSTNNWYDYDNLEWANAVTVSSSSRNNYLSAPAGTTISMNDIETMWVWIPRYSYTIGSEDGTNYYGKQGTFLDTTPTDSLPGEIDVKFVSTNTKDRGTAKYVVSSGIKSNSWYTPDAFTFGNDELSGIWVGKFETSSSNPYAGYGGGNTAELDAMIKPNITSWKYISISNIYNVGLKVSATGNRYGFSEGMNSHAMRNDEWAAVSYLSQSKYGKLGNEDFKGTNKEIYQNKSNICMTGYSNGSPSNLDVSYDNQYQYNIEINGTGASTTGTVYGIYDMSGGAWEYVMANYNDIASASGFSDPLTLESKYYDKYTSNNVSLACNGSECISHGLSETSGWYNDYHNMLIEEYPWWVRGGRFSDVTDTGVLSFGGASGGSSDDGSFHLVISPKL